MRAEENQSIAPVNSRMGRLIVWIVPGDVQAVILSESGAHKKNGLY
jgi:hypothetical protein